MRKKPPLLQRLRAKKEHAAGVVVAGVVWYTEAEWSKVKAFAEDPEVFEYSYAQWCAMAESGLREIESTGMRPRKVLVSAEALERWCDKNGKKNVGEARSEFVLELLRSMGDEHA